MPFTQPKTTIRLYPPATLPGISEGDWVDVVSAYTAGMRQRVMIRAMQVKMSVLAGAPTDSISVDVFTHNQALLEEIVEAWSDSAPVTPENLKELSPDVADWIAREFDTFIKVRPDDEKKGSSESLLPTLITEDNSPRNSPTSRKSNGLKTTVS